MFEALAINAAVLLVLVLIQWLISVKINDVSFVDAFWGAGMGVLAIVSYLQLDEPGTLAVLLVTMTAAWGFRLGAYLFARWWKEGEQAIEHESEKTGHQQGADHDTVHMLAVGGMIPLARTGNDPPAHEEG